MFGADNDSHWVSPQAEAPVYAPAHGGAQALSVTEMVRLCWRARWYAIVGALAMSVLGVAFWMVAEPAYQSSAQVYVDPKDLQLLQNDLNPNLMPGDSGTVIIESQARIMQSASVLRAVVEDLGLDTDDEFVGRKTGISLAALKAAIKGLFETEGGRTVDQVSLAVDQLAEQVNVVRADKTYVISVFAQAREPEKAARIANAVVEAYLTLRERQRADQADTASRSLENRLEGLFSRLETAEQAVETYKIENGIVGASGTLLVEDRLTQATRDIAAAELSVDRARAQRDQLALMRDNPDLFLSSAEAVGSADVSRLRSDLERLEAEIGTLDATLGPRHPRRVEAESRRASVRSSLQAELGRLYSNAVLAHDRARTRLAAATASVDRLTRDVQASDVSRVRLRQLERDAQTGRALYEEALLRSRETRERQTISTINAQLVSPATPAIRKSFPPSITILLPLAFAFGAALGGGVGVLAGLLAATAPTPLAAQPSSQPSSQTPAQTPAPAPRNAPGFGTQARRRRSGHERADEQPSRVWHREAERAARAMKEDARLDEAFSTRPAPVRSPVPAEPRLRLDAETVAAFTNRRPLSVQDPA